MLLMQRSKTPGAELSTAKAEPGLGSPQVILMKS